MLKATEAKSATPELKDRRDLLEIQGFTDQMVPKVLMGHRE